MPVSRGPFRRLLEKRAGGRLALRLQTATVLLLAFLVGVAVSHLLLRAGLLDMRWRLPLTVLAAYAAFLGLVRLWLILTGVAEGGVRPDPDHREEEPPPSSSGRDFVEKAGDVAEGIVDLGDIGSAVDAEGCLPAIGFVIFLAVLGFVLTALWWFFGGFFGAASAALVEAGVEALLAVGLARAAGGGAGNWIDGAVRASWTFWLLLAIVAWGLAFILHALAPEARTLFQALATLAG